MLAAGSYTLFVLWKNWFRDRLLSLILIFDKQFQVLFTSRFNDNYEIPTKLKIKSAVNTSLYTGRTLLLHYRTKRKSTKNLYDVAMLFIFYNWFAVIFFYCGSFIPRWQDFAKRQVSSARTNTFWTSGKTISIATCQQMAALVLH